MPTISQRQDKLQTDREKVAAEAVLAFFRELGFTDAQMNRVCSDLGRYSVAYLASVQRFNYALSATATK